jgi:ribosome-binding protein aMBF1 (putative translation factor)
LAGGFVILGVVRHNEQLVAEQPCPDPDFRTEWERTELARALAIAAVRYRAEHGMSQHDLAVRVGLDELEVERLELGDEDPDPGTFLWISARLRIDPLGGR